MMLLKYLSFSVVSTKSALIIYFPRLSSLVPHCPTEQKKEKELKANQAEKNKDKKKNEQDGRPIGATEPRFHKLKHIISGNYKC